MSYRFAVCFASVLVCGTGLAPAQTPPEVPHGCTPHVQPVSKGSIDWCEGYVVAKGIGHARGTTNKDRLAAIRAAEVVAVRNALAIAAGLPVDGSGTLGAIGNAKIQLRARVRGHKSISVDWRPDLDPPECRMTVRVPLWGVEGIGTVVYAAKQQRTRQSSSQRLRLVRPAQASDYEILIIDARGLDARPCLFPEVVTPTGHVLYDVSTLSSQNQSYRAPARYVESSLSFEALQSPSPEAPPHQDVATAWPLSPRRSSGLDQPGSQGLWATLSPGTPGAKPALSAPPASPITKKPPKITSQPTTQPTTRPVRKRRRRVVKAIVTPGDDKTRITLTREDAERLRKDPQTAHLLKNGKVVIVTDSVAAGIEGCLPRTYEEGMFAFLVD